MARTQNFMFDGLNSQQEAYWDEVAAQDRREMDQAMAEREVDYELLMADEELPIDELPDLTEEHDGTEVICNECGHTFVAILDDGDEPRCPDCGGVDLELE